MYDMWQQVDSLVTVNVRQSDLVLVLQMLVPVLLAVVGLFGEFLRRGQNKIKDQNDHITKLVNSAADELRAEIRALRKQVIGLGGVPIVPEPAEPVT